MSKFSVGDLMFDTVWKRFGFVTEVIEGNETRRAQYKGRWIEPKLLRGDIPDITFEELWLARAVMSFAGPVQVEEDVGVLRWAFP